MEEEMKKNEQNSSAGITDDEASYLGDADWMFG